MKYRNTLLAIFAAALALTVGIALALPALAQNAPTVATQQVTTLKLLDIRKDAEGYLFDFEELRPIPRRLTLKVLDIRKIDGGFEIEAEVQDAE